MGIDHTSPEHHDEDASWYRSIVPHLEEQQLDHEASPQGAQHEQKPEQPDPYKLIEELTGMQKAKEALQQETSPVLTRAVRMLNRYKEEGKDITWIAPKTPFQTFESMNLQQRAAWLLMLACTPVDAYSEKHGYSNVSDTMEATETFLLTFFPHTEGKREKLTSVEIDTIEAQFQVEGLFGHMRQYENQFDKRGARFSQQ